MTRMATRAAAALAIVISAIFVGAFSASADPTGNYAQPDVYYSCGPNWSGHFDVHFNHQHNTPAQEFPYGFFWGRDAGSAGMVRVIVYYADPGYTWGWDSIADYTYGLPGVTSGNMSTHADFRASTGRLRVTVYVSDNSVCTFGAAGDILFGKP